MHFDDRTQCYLHRVMYDFEARRGVLVMDEGSCTDMSGAISVFEAIDPEVKRIDTYAADKPDTVYRRHSDRLGGWQAYLPGRPAIRSKAA